MEYDENQRKEAAKIKKRIISTAGGPQATVCLNVVYLTCFEMKNGVPLGAEIPVLIVRTDHHRDVFFDASANEYKYESLAITEIGRCFDGGMIYHNGLSYCASKKNLKIQLVYTDSTGSTDAYKLEKHAQNILTSAGELLSLATIICSVPISAGFRYAAIARTAAGCLGVAATSCTFAS
ncbi:hypothetical protein PENTCL1PPCAC_4674 [Pristionchus entomophagus]|uniref:Uncharacterized protein n=1 Tax=Pristionchus entomophagus TaxID=358040 RepID=A0AAV5SMC2_9BILA|nr:hypothetical protein PENTCL1PPCAC_4674 [Pristionchus entomophagus]